MRAAHLLDGGSVHEHHGHADDMSYQCASEFSAEKETKVDAPVQPARVRNALLYGLGCSGVLWDESDGGYTERQIGPF